MRSWARLVICSTLLTAAAPARAEGGQQGGAAAAASARELVDAGDKLARLHLYEEALASYEKANAQAPSSALLKKIADTRLAAGDPTGAYEAYDKLRAARDLAPAQKKAVEKEINAIEANTGALTVTSTQAGATVRVDGKVVGQTPLARPLRISPGSHRIHAEKEGFDPFDAEVSLGAAQSAVLNAALEPEVTAARVHVSEKRGRTMTVLIDGKEVGKTPYWGEVAPGEHSVEVRAPKLTAPTYSVKAEPKLRAEVVVEAADTVGTLNFTVTPPSATVLLDQKPVPAGTQTLEVAAGKHEVVVSAPGYKDVRETIDVQPGVTSSFNWQLSPAPPVEKEPDYSGGHFELGFAGLFPVHARPQTCPNPPQAGQSCDEATRIGGGLILRGGYSFGVMSLDVTAVASGDLMTDKATFAGGAPAPPAEAPFQRTEEYVVNTAGGFIGLGPRLNTKGTLRVMFGLAGGVAVRGAIVKITTTGGIQDEVQESKALVGPGGVADLGIAIGSTPGVQFTVGGTLLIEKVDFSTSPLTRAVNDPAGNPLTVDRPSRRIIDGATVYVGPTLGVRFGY